mmetsp:Transcript_19487/g.26651  ORF Transcript_19487/g.26651 Transcript_19487/m.26651 type:complete len:175 (-) Transcript_19487:79-603(-)
MEVKRRMRLMLKTTMKVLRLLQWGKESASVEFILACGQPNPVTFTVLPSVTVLFAKKRRLQLWTQMIVFDNTPEPSAKSPSRIQLVLVEGGENYADCDGWYVHQGNYLNDRQVFVCEKKSRFIGWNGSTWTLTGMQWHDDFVKKEERNFGGFHANINGNCSIEKSQWKNYIVQF